MIHISSLYFCQIICGISLPLFWISHPVIYIIVVFLKKNLQWCLWLFVSEFFQNKLVETIQFMEVLNLKDSVEKDSFFRKLPNLAEQLPREIVLKKVLQLIFPVEPLIPQWLNIWYATFVFFSLYEYHIYVCLFSGPLYTVAPSIGFCSWVWFSSCSGFDCFVEDGFLASDWPI
jgi:hypothetical protein